MACDFEELLFLDYLCIQFFCLYKDMKVGSVVTIVILWRENRSFYINCFTLDMVNSCNQVSFIIRRMKFQNETMMVLFECEMFSSGSCVWTLGSWWVVLFWKVVEPLVEELYWSNWDPSGRASLGILWPCLFPVHFLLPDSDCGTVILLLLLHCFPRHDWL